MRQVPVKVFMADWCPVCRRASRWLEAGRYRFVEHDVESDPRAAALLQRMNPRGSVPTFYIEGRIVVGFDEDGLEEVIRDAARERASGSRI